MIAEGQGSDVRSCHRMKIWNTVWIPT